MKHYIDVASRVTIILLAVLFLFCAYGCRKKAEEDKTDLIKLKFSTYNLSVESPAVLATHALDLVEKKTNGRVKIERYMGGALGEVSEQLDLVSSGAVDIINLHLDQYPQQLPLHKIFNSEQFVSDEQALMNIIAITREIPETMTILDAEAKKNNIKILYCNVMGGGGITTGFPAQSLESLKGKKINVITSYQRKVYNELGIIPVNVQIPELYESLSRGVIDAILMATSAVIPLKFYEVGKIYFTLGENTLVSMPITLNRDTWDSLPPDVQQAFLEASEETARWSVEENQRNMKNTYEMFENSGVPIISVSKDESNKFWEVMSRLATEDWLENAKNRGVGEQAVIIQRYWDEMKWGKWSKE